MYGEYTPGLSDTLARAMYYVPPDAPLPPTPDFYPGQMNAPIHSGGGGGGGGGGGQPLTGPPRLAGTIFADVPLAERPMYGEHGQAGSERRGPYNGRADAPPPASAAAERDRYNGQVAVGAPGLGGRELYNGQAHALAGSRDLYSGQLHVPAAERELYNGRGDLPGCELYNGQAEAMDRTAKGGGGDGPTAETGSANNGQMDGDRDAYSGQAERYNGQTDADVVEMQLYEGQQNCEAQAAAFRDSGSQPPQGESPNADDVTPLSPASPLPALRHKVACMRCKREIQERHLFLLNDGRFLHEACCCCVKCGRSLLQQEQRCRMYLRDERLYCYKDYMQTFAGSESHRKVPVCSECGAPLGKGIWVRRAGNDMFHVTCFCCSKCERQLSGNDYILVREKKLICDKHFYDHDGSNKDESPRPRAKRMRTSFTDEQLRILNHHFAIDSNPDGQDLERIAKLTNLKKRVTQVWFQNSRARHKKTLQNKPQGCGGTPGGTPSLPSSFSPPVSGGASVYASTSEEGDSSHGGEMGGVYGSDLDRPEEAGIGSGGGGGGGGVSMEYAQPPSFCNDSRNQVPMFRQLTDRQRSLPSTITSQTDVSEASTARHELMGWRSSSSSSSSSPPLSPSSSYFSSSSSSMPLYFPPSPSSSYSYSSSPTSSGYYPSSPSSCHSFSSSSRSSCSPTSGYYFSYFPSSFASSSYPFSSSLGRPFPLPPWSCSSSSSPSPPRRSLSSSSSFPSSSSSPPSPAGTSSSSAPASPPVAPSSSFSSSPSSPAPAATPPPPAAAAPVAAAAAAAGTASGCPTTAAEVDELLARCPQLAELHGL